MSYSVTLEKLAREKQQAREIVSEVLKFGVTEQQKLDIMHGLVLSLENNSAIKDINNILKKYREIINKEEQEDNINQDKPNKIILE